MKIAILGAGRMGSLVAGFATRGGADCYLIDTWKEHVDAINQDGLTIYNNEDPPFNVKCKAFTSADQIGEKMDLIIVLVMGSVTEQAVSASMCLADEHTYCMTLQNGLGNVEIIEKYYAPEKIIFGIMPYGGTVLGPGKVKTLINANAESHFGPHGFEDPDAFMKSFEAIMLSQGLNFYAASKTEVNRIVWWKLAKNASGNAICGVCRLPLGPYTNCQYARPIEVALFYETAAVAAAQGITLPQFDTGNNIAETSKMYNHLPSTAQDMKSHHKTEIDFINGAVARLGDKYGIPTPYNHMITALVKTIESNYDKQY